MPEASRFLALLRPHRRRFRLAAIARSLVLASAAAGAVLASASVSGVGPQIGRGIAALIFVAAAAGASGWWWRQWSTARVAAAIESRAGTLDNVVVTAEEVASGRLTRPHPMVEAELFDAAVHRLEQVPRALAWPLRSEVALALASIVAFVALFASVPAGRIAPRDRDQGSSPEQTRPLGPTDLRVVVIPPAYTQRPRSESLNPTSVVALEGSRVRLEVARTAPPTVLLDATGSATPFAPGENALGIDVIASASRPLIIRQDAAGAADRLLQLRVQRDNAPVVRIETPGKDLLFPEPTGQVAVDIVATDDVGLASLALRYTRMSGSGEAFSFEDGEWPIQISRGADGRWSAHAVLTLGGLELQDGDTLVYRALARDARPGADPAASDSFLIEVGRLAGVASTGFALPDDRDRQAISQQMLIVKTEALDARRSTLAPEDYREQSRLLAIEQRMVKAEFVFMTGGEVADEVEEAEHAHELAEGRQANAAHVELLAAIREMSRAEARLNDGDTTLALPFERAALRALQRAFDRRRYLLRTLPERTRIDLSRRLTGDLGAARSSGQHRGGAEADAVVTQARALVRELDGLESDGEASLVASRIIAIDPASETLQGAAVQLANARDAQGRARAIRQAQTALIEAMRARLGRGGSTAIVRDPLAGGVVEELRRGSGGGR